MELLHAAVERLLFQVHVDQLKPRMTQLSFSLNFVYPRLTYPAYFSLHRTLLEPTLQLRLDIRLEGLLRVFSQPIYLRLEFS